MKKQTKRIFALLLCIVMLLAIAACNSTDNGGDSSTSGGTQDGADGGSSGGGGDANTNTGGNSNTGDGGDRPVSARDTVSVAISGDTGSLERVFAGFAGIIYQYYEPLVNFKADGTPVWLLATNIEEVSTEQWIIHCREGVKFSNGSDFNAYDVWFTFDRILSDPSSAFFLSCIDLENSSIIDDYTLDIALVNYSIQQMGSLSQIFIKDGETYDEDAAATNPIGTGPWIVTEYVTNSHVYMRANENYWGGKPAIENLHYRVFNEDAQVVNAIQTGLVDVAGVPSQEVDFVMSLPGYNVLQYANVFAATLTFFMSTDSVMNDLNARLAVCHALDREAIANLAYFGQASVINYPVSVNCYDYEPRFSNMHPTYSVGMDLELARGYAEAAGIVGQDIVVITNGSPAYVTSAEILQACMKEIGVNVIINNYDGATYMDASRDTTMYDMTMYAAASPQGLAIGIIYEYIMWGGDQYATGWPEHPQYMQLGARGVATLDSAARSEILYEMLQMFTSAVPWYGLCEQVATLAINSALGGTEVWGSGVLRYADWYWTS